MERPIKLLYLTNIIWLILAISIIIFFTTSNNGTCPPVSTPNKSLGAFLEKELSLYQEKFGPTHRRKRDAQDPDIEWFDLSGDDGVNLEEIVETDDSYLNGDYLDLLELDPTKTRRYIINVPTNIPYGKERHAACIRSFTHKRRIMRCDLDFLRDRAKKYALNTNTSKLRLKQIKEMLSPVSPTTSILGTKDILDLEQARMNALEEHRLLTVDNTSYGLVYNLKDRYKFESVNAITQSIKGYPCCYIDSNTAFSKIKDCCVFSALGPLIKLNIDWPFKKKTQNRLFKTNVWESEVVDALCHNLIYNELISKNLTEYTPRMIRCESLIRKKCFSPTETCYAEELEDSVLKIIMLINGGLN